MLLTLVSPGCGVIIFKWQLTNYRSKGTYDPDGYKNLQLFKKIYESLFCKKGGEFELITLCRKANG